MLSSSDQLDQMISHYKWAFSSYPDIKELTQLLCDVTHDEKVRILKRHDPLFRAAHHGDTEIITTILSSVPQHQRLDVLLVDQWTPLHSAASRGNSDCVETILTHLTPEQQLKILSVGCRGRGNTPADYASLIGHEKIETLLRDYKQRAEKQRAEKQRAEKQTGGILRKLKHFLIGSNDTLKRDTGHGNNRYRTDTALILYSKEGREDGATTTATEEATLLESSLSKVIGHVIRQEWSIVTELEDSLQTNITGLGSDCSLLFISVMSHGRMGALCGPDGIMLPVNDLIGQISQAIPADLRLVLLIQACQGFDLDSNSGGDTDAASLPTDAKRGSAEGCMHIDLVRPNTVLLMATATGGSALRGAYIKALAAEISKADGKKDIHEMHLSAVKEMRNNNVDDLDDIKQVPNYRDTMDGRLVLSIIN